METIKDLINTGKINEAIDLLDQLIAENTSSDEAFYLRGNAYRKLGNWKEAVNNYLSAMELNPESPARQAYQMAIQIFDFYHKDRFNQ